MLALLGVLSSPPTMERGKRADGVTYKFSSAHLVDILIRVKIETDWKEVTGKPREPRRRHRQTGPKAANDLNSAGRCERKERQ